MFNSPALQRTFSRLPEWLIIVLAASAAFSTYFCMYAFRKPFAAGTFEGSGWTIPGLDRLVELKTLLVISQIIGYAISKYVGIKVCSEVGRRGRAALLVSLIVVAQVSLVLFAIVPPKFGAVALFLNGLPLGMVWGLVVLYLEGRRSSELLLAALSCSFILASGVVKDIGRHLMTLGISEYWMPAATGIIFFVPFVLLVWLMDHLPDPTNRDIEERSARSPMQNADRFLFIKSLFPAILPLLISYFVLTAYRDFRDNYGVEMFAELGYAGEPTIFSRSELPVAFGVLAVLAALNFVRSNRWGLLGAHAVMWIGAAMLAGSTMALNTGLISGLTWMILVGLGAYLAYVPFGSVLFDRMMAATRLPGTAVFAIYLADAIGYTGSVGVQLYKDLFAGDSSRLEFFKALTFVMSGVGMICFSASALYLFMRSRAPRVVDPQAKTPATMSAKGVTDLEQR